MIAAHVLSSSGLVLVALEAGGLATCESVADVAVIGHPVGALGVYCRSSIF